MKIKGELVLLGTSIKRLEIHLLTLNLLADEEPITEIEDKDEHLSMINNHFERLKTLESLFSETINMLYCAEKALSE